MRARRFICLITAFLFPILLVGCFNYRDINKVTFTTSIIFDTDDFGRAVIYVDCVKPYRSTNESSDKGRRIIYKGIGKTALEALKDINLASSYELNYSQNRAYIFTEKAAREGVKGYLDLINNNQEFQIKPDIFVYFGEVKDLLKVTSSDEEYLGLYLEELVHKNKRNPRSIRANINEYLSKSIEDDKTYIVGAIEIREDALDKKIQIGGGAVIKDSKLVNRLEAKDALSYNLLMDNVSKGTLEISNPQSEEGFITLEILSSSTKSDLKYEDNKLKLIKDLEIKVSIAEAQDNFFVDKDTLLYIKEAKQLEVENYLKNIFEIYKKEGLDIFEIQRLLDVKNLNIDIEDPLSITELETNVKIIIEGTGIVRDSL